MKVIKAPYTLFVVGFGFIPLMTLFAWVSVSGWCEDGIRMMGVKRIPEWLPPVVGCVMYIGIGIVLPGYLGYLWLGWVGIVLTWVLGIGAVAVLGRW